jgi:hypothetical protein
MTRTPVRSRRPITLVLVPALVGLLALAGCGALADAGPQTTTRRSIDDVAAVDLQTSGDLTVTIGETPGLTITAGANQLDYLTSEVNNGTLLLDSRANMPSGGTVSYALVVPSLTSVDISGSGSATGDGVLRGDATVSGSGDVNLTGLQVPSVAVALSGSGKATLAGSADTQQIDISGSGGYIGKELSAGDTGIEVTGSGNASVTVSGRLAVSISGSGDVTYFGSPTQVEKSVSGSGSVNGG